VLKVRLKAKLIDETNPQFFQIRRTQVRGASAPPAYHVLMLVGLCHLVSCGITTKVYLCYKVKALEKLEYAIYGRYVQIRICLDHFLVNRLSRLVLSTFGDGSKDHQPLWCQTVPRFS
jgi:hypothetical protein